MMLDWDRILKMMNKLDTWSRLSYENGCKSPNHSTFFFLPLFPFISAHAVFSVYFNFLPPKFCFQWESTLSMIIKWIFQQWYIKLQLCSTEFGSQFYRHCAALRELYHWPFLGESHITQLQVSVTEFYNSSNIRIYCWPDRQEQNLAT